MHWHIIIYFSSVRIYMIKTDFFFIFEKKNDIFFFSTRKPLRTPRTCFSAINRVLLYLLQTPRRLFFFFPDKREELFQRRSLGMFHTIWWLSFEPTVMAFHTQQDMPETPLPPIVTRPFHAGFKKWQGFNFLFCWVWCYITNR